MDPIFDFDEVLVFEFVEEECVLLESQTIKSLEIYNSRESKNREK